MVIVETLSRKLELLQIKQFNILNIQNIVSHCFSDVHFKKIKTSFVSISSNGQSNQIPLNLSNMVKLFNNKHKFIDSNTKPIKTGLVRQHKKETTEQIKERLQAEHEEAKKRAIQKQKAEQERVETQRRLREQLERETKIREEEIKLEERLKKERNKNKKNGIKSQIIKLKLERLDSNIEKVKSYFKSSNKKPKELTRLVWSIVDEFKSFLTESETEFFSNINTKPYDDINKKFNSFIARLIVISTDNSQVNQNFNSNQRVFNQQPRQAVASSAVASSAEEPKKPDQMIQKFLDDYHFTDTSRNGSKLSVTKLKPLIYETTNNKILSSLEAGKNGKPLFDKKLIELENKLKELNKEYKDVNICIQYLEHINTEQLSKYQKAPISSNLTKLGRIKNKLSTSIMNLNTYKKTIEILKKDWENKNQKQAQAQPNKTAEEIRVQSALNNFM
jgi:hypothetical protein